MKVRNLVLFAVLSLLLVACSPREKSPHGRCFKTFDCPHGLRCIENWCYDMTKRDYHFDPRID